MRNFIIFVLFLFNFKVFAEETHDKNTSPPDIAKLSEAFGHLIAKSLDANDVKYDVAKVLKGLQNSLDGKESPMSETEYFQAIAQIQKECFMKACDQNLKQANQFLENNKTEPGVVVLEEGKLHVKVTQEGSGTETVELHSTPFIKYKGSLINGHVFDESKEGISIHLDETIQGFQKGLVGMKKGEARTLYIHPDFGYGKQFQSSPNSLLTFEVTVIEPETVLQTEEQGIIEPSSTHPEIAHPFQEQQVLR